MEMSEEKKLRMCISCAQMIKQQGGCFNISCDDCPGSSDYNKEYINCVESGWKSETGNVCIADELCVKNAKKFIQEQDITFESEPIRPKLSSGDFVVITKYKKDANLKDWYIEKLFQIIQVVEDDGVLKVFDPYHPNTALFLADEPEVLLEKIEVEIVLK